MVSERLIDLIERSGEELTKRLVDDLLAREETRHLHKLRHNQNHSQVYDVYHMLNSWLAATRTKGKIVDHYVEMGREKYNEGIRRRMGDRPQRRRKGRRKRSSPPERTTFSKGDSGRDDAGGSQRLSPPPLFRLSQVFRDSKLRNPPGGVLWKGHARTVVSHRSLLSSIIPNG